MKDTKIKTDLLDWLVEPGDIGVKYLAMRDLLKADGNPLLAVKKLAHEEGPIANSASTACPRGPSIVCRATSALLCLTLGAKTRVWIKRLSGWPGA